MTPGDTVLAGGYGQRGTVEAADATHVAVRIEEGHDWSLFGVGEVWSFNRQDVRLVGRQGALAGMGVSA